MNLAADFFYDEVRDGFYIPGIIKRAWGAQLYVLSVIDKICRKHGIQYFVYAGTLLGAIREKQYIPWDDDLDTCMLRSEFDKFKKVVETELPDGISFNSIELYPEYCCLVHVVGTAKMEMNAEKLKEYCEFPYPVSIDIFVLEDLARDPEEEAYRKSKLRLINSMLYFVQIRKENTPAFQEGLQKLGNLLGVPFDSERSIKVQLYQALDRVCREFNGEGGDRVSYLPDQLDDENNFYDKAAFSKARYLPFCGIEVPVPVDYDAVLRAEFGDYRKKVKAGGEHGYPYFIRSEKKLKEAMGEKWKWDYVFQEEDLERPLVENFREILLHAVEDFQKTEKQIATSFMEEDYTFVLSALSTAQEGAIALGNAIEQRKGEGRESVLILEKFCEEVYQLYQMQGEMLSQGNSTVSTQTKYVEEGKQRINKLDRLLRKLQKAVKKECKRQIVFLPHSVKHFESLRPLVDAFLKTGEMDVKIIPIPYYDRQGFGEFSTMHYEGMQFPEEYEIVDYRTYDFEAELPDCIVLNTPYDACNPVWSVDPFFYSKEMKKYTNSLVYIPYFVTEEIHPGEEEDGKAFANMRYYVTVPGVFHADCTIVQSEEMKKTYLTKIARFTNATVRKRMRKKISGAGSCLYGEREGQGGDAVFQKLRKFIERRSK